MVALSRQLSRMGRYAARVPRAVHREEDGKITLIAMIMMLAMVVLMGLIGNAGHAVNQKIELQNAADAAAFSSALWMARGMNALTATNHLLGEATALCAIHEALGGASLDFGLKQNTTENQTLDGIIDANRELAPLGPSPFGFTPPFVMTLDRQIVDFVTARVTPENGNREFEACAAIFDSRMTLKRELAVLLPIKTFADVGFFVPPPWGYGTALIAYGVHIYSTSQIVLIGKEWVVLDVVEKVAKAFTRLKLDVIEAQLIPTLAAHGEFVAGYDADEEEFQGGILNRAVERMMLDLQDRHRAQLTIFPAAEELRLPVETEPVPNLRSGGNLASWGSDAATPFAGDNSGLGNLRRRLNKSKRAMRDRIDELGDNLADFDDFEQEIEERLAEGNVPADERLELESEQAALVAARADLQRRLEKLKVDLAKLESMEGQLDSQRSQPNPSANPSVARVPELMNQGQEQYSQWVRATYPYSDIYRAHVRAMFQNWLPKSKAAEHFTKWSNRYTMTKAWQFRSGYRLEKAGNALTWRKSDSVKPLRMFVLKDSFDGERSRKGRENWTTSTPDGKRTAESYFTVVGFAQRDFQPLFAKIVYPAATSKGISAYSQAIVYNANETASAESDRWQRKFGWDTLNWDPTADIPEWAAPATQSEAKWPWDIFTQSEPSVQVKLNWQAKLMPVTPTRLADTEPSLSGELGGNVRHAIEYFEELGTH